MTDVRGSDAALSELDEPMLAELAQYGHERAVASGETLYRAGDEIPGFFAVLEGEVEIVREDDGIDVVVARHGPARFLGELNLLTGQRAYLTARMVRDGRVLQLDLPTFRHV